MDPQFFKRSVNEGFSGGEKKRNEILQMAVLQPKLAVLDETDSGLDIDALRIVAEGVNTLRSPDNAIILVTHYQRLLNFIVPDMVHVLAGGKIVKEGGKELASNSRKRAMTGLREREHRWLRIPSQNISMPRSPAPRAVPPRVTLQKRFDIWRGHIFWHRETRPSIRMFIGLCSSTGYGSMT